VDGVLGRPVEGRKTVTVLFCDLVAFTELAEQLDPEALRELMSTFFDRAARVVEQHGGLVEKFVGDEVMAVFGIPAVHEDDALRALRAAIDVRECVEQLDRETDVRLEVRVGVNTGEVVTSDPALGHGFVSGDAVAVGKRLEQAAGPGEIVFGDTTHALVAHAVDAEQLEPLALKGKAGLTTAFRLNSIDPDAAAIPRRADTPLVGHVGELERLRGIFAEVAAGSARLVTVVGEVGIGKSRLARELMAEVEDDARVLVGRCPPYGEGLTFSPVRELFRQAGRDDNELDGSSYEAFAATRRLLEELASEQPVLATFDDIHWAEDTLLDLLEHLSSRLGAAPVLLLCLARPYLAERRPQWLLDPAGAFTLESLSDAESRALIEALDPPAGVGDRIVELAEGNPLFIEQLAAFAHEDGEGVALAGSIRGVLHARLDRLHREERAVLERAAVVGRSFSLEAVLELIPPEEHEHAHSRLFELARRGLIRPDVALPEEGFRFQHALIREAVYEAMPKTVRADLHGAVAARLEAGGGADALAGYHLERAFQLDRELGRRDASLGARAGRLLRRAAQETAGRGDAPATVSLLERARALLPADDGELPLVLAALGGAHMNAGDMPAAESVLEEAVEAAAAQGDRAAELHARIERQFVRTFSAATTSVEESVSLAEDAIAELEQLGDELALARAWWLRSTGDVLACRWRKRAEAIERALAHARRAHAGLEMVSTLSGLLAQALLHGPTPVADAVARVEQLPQELGLDRARRSSVDTSLAGLLAMRGDVQEARRLYRSAAATYEEFGLRFRRATQAFVGAQIELWAGDLGAAESELRSSSVALAAYGASTSATTHRALLADIVCSLERFDEAEVEARQVASEAPEEDLVAHVLWRSALSRVLARRGSAVEAEELAEQVLALSAGVEFPFLRVVSLTATAEVEAAAGRATRARQLLEEGRGIMAAKGNLAEVARLDALAAQLG
jgi:class 3 adenylate cyclase/tetratricopeptide (TPR) repeat protein